MTTTVSLPSNSNEEILRPEFDSIEKSSLNFNNEEIECFLLDDIKYTFGLNLCKKIGKQTSSLYTSIRHKTDWETKVLFKLDNCHKNTDTILNFMSYKHQTPAFVVRLTDEFLKWLINYCSIKPRSTVSVTSKRLHSTFSRSVLSGELHSQSFYQMKDYWYYLFTLIQSDKTRRRFIFMTDATTFLAKNIYNFTKGSVTFYTPDSKLKSDLKICGLLSDNSNNQNLIDFDDEIFWSLIYSKFGIEKPLVDESSVVLKDKISFRLMRKNNKFCQIKPTNTLPVVETSVCDVFSDDEVDDVSLASEDFEENQSDLDYVPPSKKSRVDINPQKDPPQLITPIVTPSEISIPVTSSVPSSILWTGLISIDGAKHNIPLIAKETSEHKINQKHDWPKTLLPIGVCSAKQLKFINEISNRRFFTFEFDSQSPDSLPVHFEEFLKIRDTLIKKSSALVVQLEDTTIVILVHVRQLIGLLFPKMNLIHKSVIVSPANDQSDKSIISQLQTQIKTLELKVQKMESMEKTIENQSKLLFQISSLLKSFSNDESSETSKSVSVAD
jgi:hypothetical protein